MDCCAPDTIHEDDLVIAALNPEDLSAEVRQHVTECPACAERVAAYQRLPRMLTHHLYRWDCPSPQEISDYAAGWLTGKRRRTIGAHLRRCPRCAEELQASLQFLAPAPAPAPGRPRLVAQLLPMRPGDVALGGIRGESSKESEGWPRQYQVAGFSLSLHRAAPSGGGTGAMLLGLISHAEAPPEAFAGIEVRLLASGASDQPPLVTERVDDLGNFLLSPIPTGRFDLLIELPEGDLVIEGLELSW